MNINEIIVCKLVFNMGMFLECYEKIKMVWSVLNDIFCFKSIKFF